MAITASEARDRLFPLIKEINDDQAAVEIVSRGVTAYLVPADEYRSLIETAHLLRSPRNAERLRASLRAVHRGHTAKHELLEAGTDPAPASEMSVYVIRERDTLASIAAAHGLTVEELRTANNMAEDEFPGVGRLLRVEVSDVHVVALGERDLNDTDV